MFLDYGVAFWSVVLAALLRIPLFPLIGTDVPYVTFFPAIAVSAWFGGVGPGLFAVAFGFLSAQYHLIHPHHSFALSTEADAFGALAYGFAGATICLMTGYMRSAQRRTADEAMERKVAQDQLFVTLYSIGDAVIATDAAGRVTMMNAVAQRLTGWTLEEAMGRDCGEVYRIVNEATRAPVESPVTGLLRDGALQERAKDTVLISRDGRDTCIDETGALIRRGAREVFGVVLVFRDVTERRAMEAERARLYEAEHTARLAAERDDRAKDELLAMLSHELRNPLGAVANSITLARLRDTPGSRLARPLEIAERQVRHMSRLVDELLDVARLTQGKIALQRSLVALDELAADCVRAAAPRAEGKGLALGFTAAGRVPVLADPARMEQVLSNLLTNALKYTDTGRVDVCVRRDGGQAVLEVRDTGIGISEDLLPGLFGLFTQAERTLARSEGGLGIGLTLVQRIVEMHDGTVHLQSAGPAQGTLATVRLPLAEDAVAEPVRPPDVFPETGERSWRVLVVDDNVDAAETLTDILEMWGHTIQAVHTGQEALDAVASFHPDAVLLDIGLPGMDGYQVVRALRRAPESSGLKIVAVTGYGQSEDRERARRRIRRPSGEAGGHHGPAGRSCPHPIDAPSASAVGCR